MGQLFSNIFRAVRQNLRLYITIVLVLAIGIWINKEWNELQRLVSELPRLQEAHKNASEHQAALERVVTDRTRMLSTVSANQIATRIRSIEDEERRLHQEQGSISLPASAVTVMYASPEQLRDSVRRAIKIEILRQEKEHLVALRAHLNAVTDRQTASVKLEQFWQVHEQAYAALQTGLSRRSQVRGAARLWGEIPFTREYKDLMNLDGEVKVLRATNDKAHKDYLAQKRLVDSFKTALPPVFQVDKHRLAAELAPLDERIRHAEESVAKHLGWKVYLAFQPLLLPAAWILLAWYLVPVVIRSVFYYGLAPWAARQQPIVIRPEGRNPPVPRPQTKFDESPSSLISAVSQTVTLFPGHELLIRQNYCQSLPFKSKITTRFLFDWSHWATSIAAHLWMLTHIHTAHPANIVVSSAEGGFDDIALLEIGPKAAFVLQPRALVGVIYPTDQPPRIRTHWRLTSLHGWLTLQLRYLSFEGPATLIVKGCRGVRLENASTGRTISQDATLGFCAGIVYSTVRNEPFLPYLRGMQPLLRDRFAGHNAYYLYEEAPHKRLDGEQRNNPLEALIDAGLKAFGI